MRRGHVAEQRLRSSRLVLKTAATRGSARGLRRRHCSGNVSTTQQKAHKTPAAATAKTPKSGLEITAGRRANIKYPSRPLPPSTPPLRTAGPSGGLYVYASPRLGVNVRYCRVWCVSGL